MATKNAKTTAKKSTSKKVVAKKGKKTAKCPHTPMCISGSAAEISNLKSKARKAQMSVSRYVFEVLLK